LTATSFRSRYSRCRQRPAQHGVRRHCSSQTSRSKSPSSGAYFLNPTLISLVYAGSIVLAGQAPQNSILHSGFQSANYDWFEVSLEDRTRLFSIESRDPKWAPAMERAIQEKVAQLDRPLTEVLGEGVCNSPMCHEEMPPVHLAHVECRSSICNLELHWPPGTPRSIIGQQTSLLSQIGLDHQGWSASDHDKSRVRHKMYMRRKY